MRNLVAAVLVALAAPAGAAPSARAAFDAAVAPLKAGGTDADFHALRLQYAALPGFSGDGWADEEAAGKLLDAGQFDKALQRAEARLAKNYLDTRAQVVAYVALTELKREPEAQHHLAVMRGILRSIREHGDGMSAATAWTAITVAEEYDVVRTLGATVERQALSGDGGHNFDVLTVRFRDGVERDLWFNIDLFYGKELGGASGK